jgi:hypothetical protein
MGQPSHLATSSHSWRARRPGATRRPSQRYVWRLKTPLAQPTGHASAQGPCRLRHAPQPAVDPLLGCPALDLRRESAGEIRHPAADRKHGLGQTDGRFRWEHSGNHYPYLIGTVQNRHRGPLSRSGSDVPAQQLSRYAGAAAWPARGRPDDNLQAAGQPNSRVSAHRCIQGPAWVRQRRDRAREVERLRRTCAAAPTPPPKSSRNLCLGWKPVWAARSRTTPPSQLTGTAAPP